MRSLFFFIIFIILILYFILLQMEFLSRESGKLGSLMR
ncbi:hypothetical protein IC007_1394 [Sulfuracidifex tepidarius]|uniref:Uncharacterized protein n=1 Tax=Sulfuracidifex tepidarius TaxID=1294262 RepID=A0A510E2Z2_9CREN|nr:hypothetical protein IC007_1394 [Sulfuracidifex tepidarius]